MLGTIPLNVETYMHSLSMYFTDPHANAGTCWHICARVHMFVCT